MEVLQAFIAASQSFYIEKKMALAVELVRNEKMKPL